MKEKIVKLKIKNKMAEKIGPKNQDKWQKWRKKLN